MPPPTQTTATRAARGRRPPRDLAARQPLVEQREHGGGRDDERGGRDEACFRREQERRARARQEAVEPQGDVAGPDGRAEEEDASRKPDERLQPRDPEPSLRRRPESDVDTAISSAENAWLATHSNTGAATATSDPP